MFVASSLRFSRTASRRSGSVLLMVVPYQFEPNMRASAMSTYDPEAFSSFQASSLTEPPSPQTGSRSLMYLHWEKLRSQLNLDVDSC
jgi:hypothetical protein